MCVLCTYGDRGWIGRHGKWDRGGVHTRRWILFHSAFYCEQVSVSLNVLLQQDLSWPHGTPRKVKRQRVQPGPSTETSWDKDTCGRCSQEMGWMKSKALILSSHFLGPSKQKQKQKNPIVMMMVIIAYYTCSLQVPNSHMPSVHRGSTENMHWNPLASGELASFELSGWVLLLWVC